MSAPLYVRIQQYIKMKIDSGEWAPGDVIPTEAELSKQFGCSRITVTTALRELVKDGAVYRIQGKGTFVAERPAEPQLYNQANLTRTSMTIAELSLPGEHKCVGYSEEEANEEIASILQLKPGQHVICVDRVKYVDGKVSFLEKTYFPQVLYAAVSREQFETESVTKISDECEILLGKSYISSEPTICTAEVGAHLGIPENTAILKFCIELHDMQGRPAVCEIVYTRGKQEKTILE